MLGDTVFLPEATTCLTAYAKKELACFIMPTQAGIHTAKVCLFFSKKSVEYTQLEYLTMQ